MLLRFERVFTAAAIIQTVAFMEHYIFMQDTKLGPVLPGGPF